MYTYISYHSTHELKWCKLRVSSELVSLVYFCFHVCPAVCYSFCPDVLQLQRCGGESTWISWMMQAYAPSDALLIVLWSGGSLDRSDGSCCLRDPVQCVPNCSLCGEVICGCQNNWAEHRGMKKHHVCNQICWIISAMTFLIRPFLCLFLAIKITI